MAEEASGGGMYAGRWGELKGQAKSWLAQGAKDLHNQIVPAFPAYVHGVDEPGTPLNMGSDPVGKPSFEESMASQKPAVTPAAPTAEKGLEL